VIDVIGDIVDQDHRPEDRYRDLQARQVPVAVCYGAVDDRSAEPRDGHERAGIGEHGGKNDQRLPGARPNVWQQAPQSADAAKPPALQVVVQDYVIRCAVVV
jgi:hypothetical protein